MEVLKISIVVFVLALPVAMSEDPSTCLDCALVLCRRPVGCKGGVVNDPCRCCPYCARVFGEKCNVPGEPSRCDVDLNCRRYFRGYDICDCPVYKCYPCEYGYVVDARGCQTCQCKPAPDCPVYKCYPCEYGYVVDARGCQTCQCKPKPDCSVYKCYPCEYGYVVDASGCQTCQCKPAPGQCLESTPRIINQFCLQVITTFCTNTCECCEYRNACNPNPSLYTRAPENCRR